ncbi:Predicted transcriptional regulator YdeE, contains AraC-type DNA-binding domain [Flexibacter flexilis DSM 6793]|uniref:Predicted transcriptional regulator YdeE, contains AraC-type DNA-binding domain n=1 Tax=Flexibacter flexilis DSM 6793 TaxID=927664 RepID=A0A1I1DFD3_9BACT|nr:GyrI-like domain-containing protein [Flexibacter flexilis]SFB73651.1 Predicted transcriptional regulator YdeE, contains AraC-type DNA-binding domain [Flexibacter flexilis DSM 6793]
MNGFNVIGIAVRTTNANQQAAQDLGKLWETFFSQNIMAQIPNKVSDEILSIYTDYESDYRGAYTTVLGMKVSSLDHVPEGLVGRHFPAEKFQVFVAKGAMPQAVVNTWIEIWGKDSVLGRKYTYDFEVYGAKSQNGENSEVEIFIAV